MGRFKSCLGYLHIPWSPWKTVIVTMKEPENWVLIWLRLFLHILFWIIRYFFDILFLIVHFMNEIRISSFVLASLSFSILVISFRLSTYWRNCCCVAYYHKLFLEYFHRPLLLLYVRTWVDKYNNWVLKSMTITSCDSIKRLEGDLCAQPVVYNFQPPLSVIECTL